MAEMMKKIKIGLLPFYIELYDKILAPEKREPFEAFYTALAASFQERGVDGKPAREEGRYRSF